MARRRELLTALEIGTSTLKMVVACEEPGGELHYLAHRSLPTNGAVLKGEIIDGPALHDLLVDAFTALDEKIPRLPGVLCLAISGPHVACRPVHASIPLYGDARVQERHKEDADRQLQQNRSMGRQILFCETHAYFVDDSPKVEPVGIAGSNLTAAGFMATASDAAVSTVEHMLLEGVDVRPRCILFPGVAAYYGLDSALHRDGTLVIDMGAGVTEFGLFVGNSCRHCGLVCVGTDHVANDVSVALNLPIDRARETVENFGAALVHVTDGPRQFKVDMGAAQPVRTIHEHTLNTVIECRLRETLGIVREHLADSGDLDCLETIALCGGGAMIREVDKLASDIFKCHAVRTAPSEMKNMDTAIKSPKYTTPVGLLRWGQAALHQDDEGEPGGFDLVRTEVISAFKRIKGSLHI